MAERRNLEREREKMRERKKERKSSQLVPDGARSEYFWTRLHAKIEVNKESANVRPLRGYQ